MSFVHLHTHTHYSLLDGLSRPKEIAKIAREQGSPAIAMTDHGVLYGAIEFYKAVKDEGIKPIIGCEIYVAPQGRLRKEPGTPIHHLTVLAESTEGYHNLIELQSKAHLEGFYYKPRVDHGLLHEYRKGLIALSGCLAGEVAQAVLAGNEEKAVEIIKMYQNLLGSENYFLEVQDHAEMPDQVLLNQAIYRLAKITNAPVVATNDSHYVRFADKDVHDILLCIQTGKKVQETNRMHYDGDFSIRHPDDMKAAFVDHPEAIENTLRVAERCNVEIKFGKNLIPQFKPPRELGVQEYLRELCEAGLKKRYGDVIEETVRTRLEYELEVIHNAGFDTYFLIVHDFVDYAKTHGVIVGPGRGSAAGSLVAYVLDITDVDPLQYDLLFERFLNPARVSMPDIDIDFDDARRGEVLEYVVQKYGRNNVAQIITFGTMAARAAVRDVGRAMGYPYAEVDGIAKLVPPPIQGRHIPLPTSIKEDPGLKHVYESNSRAKSLLDYAIRLEGTVRHAGTHACAVVMSEEPLTNYTPLQRAPGDDEGVITQFSMKPLEELGLLKVDFLGLKNLTIIHETLESIERRLGTKIDLTHLPLDDKKTFKLLAHGDTMGVFQLESPGMRRYLKELKPSVFNDIIAMVSLYRPGPMAWIPMYIKGKHDPTTVEYLHPTFESILKETHGVAVYQEQILRIARDFAGFSLGEADILRKAVGKKDPKLLAGEYEKFVAGAQKQGHKKSFAQEVFEKVIEPFAGYGFNKSHATCYAMIAYRTAYLKAHYPAEFMAALMTADASNEERIAIEVNEAFAMGMLIQPPSVNESLSNFTVVDEKTIRFGLKAIKGVGENPVAAIIEARLKSGPFTSIEDFCRRVPSNNINKKLVEAMAMSGALEPFGERKRLAVNVDAITKFAKIVQARPTDGQTDIFGMMDDGGGTDATVSLVLERVAPASRLECLRWEKQYLGLFVSGHPLQGLKKYLAKKAQPIGKITEQLVAKPIRMCGIITTSKRVMTKGGGYMAIFELEDLTGRIEAIAFPKYYEACAASIGDGKIVVVEGRLDVRRDNYQLNVQKIKEVSLDSMVANAKSSGQFDENETFTVITPTIREPEEGVNGAGKKSASASSGPFTIEITEKMDAAGLDYLKSLLRANQGKEKVIIHMKLTDREHTIPVPFGVDLTRELKEQIASIAK